MPSVEEKVEEYFKKILDANKVRHYGKTENGWCTGRSIDSVR